MCFLITGVAGFIGSALAKGLLNNGENVIGLDNLNSYYDVKLKINRLKNIESTNQSKKELWRFENCDIENYDDLRKIFFKYKPKTVINLAAQAGVRYSLVNPHAYIKTNLLGFGNILELCKDLDIEHLIYASSSSVYGGNNNFPYHEDQEVGHPISLYAATKRSNELMAHSYSHIYQLPCTGLRFFTVYGPWGRPDMAPMIFTKSIFSKKKIDIYNFGNMVRDFTFIDDVVEGLLKCCYKKATKNESFDPLCVEPSSSLAPFRIFNLGNSKPIELMKFINILEEVIGLKAIKNFVEISPGDVIKTEANTSKLKNWINYEPQTDIYNGVSIFIKWYKSYYGLE